LEPWIVKAEQTGHDFSVDLFSDLLPSRFLDLLRLAVEGDRDLVLVDKLGHAFAAAREIERGLELIGELGIALGDEGRTLAAGIHRPFGSYLESFKPGEILGAA